GENDLAELRQSGQTDLMARPGWGFLDQPSYTLNSYGKPALSMLTLERLVGEETMTRIMGTYARRYVFAHPTTADFIAVVNEVTGRDYRWFFDQTFFSSDLCDYAVEVENVPVRPAAGYVDGPEGRPALATPQPDATPPTRFDGSVIVRRLGGVRLPVEVRIELEGGRTETASWDGQDRWTRLRFPGAKVTRAVVDPARTLAIDVDRSNNS